jgi:hypothetical protein
MQQFVGWVEVRTHHNQWVKLVLRYWFFPHPNPLPIEEGVVAATYTHPQNHPNLSDNLRQQL